MLLNLPQDREVSSSKHLLEDSRIKPNLKEELKLLEGTQRMQAKFQDGLILRNQTLNSGSD